MAINHNSEFQNNISGVINAISQIVDLTSSNSGTTSIQLIGTWSGTLTVEASNDEINYITIRTVNNSTLQLSDSINNNGIFIIPSSAYKSLRIRSTIWSSGSVTITGSGSDATSYIFNTSLGNSTILSPIPAFTAISNKVLTAGVSILDSYTMTSKIAITDFRFGGRGIGQASLFRVNNSAIEFVPGGGFNSSSDVSMWTNAGNGSSSNLTWTYSTAQFIEGTGSASLTFTQSDNNNFPAIRYTWSSPKNVNEWEEISAHVRVTVAGGGAQSRRVQIILTDVNNATRIYEITGTANTAPFNTEQWLQILGVIDSPNSETGTFDPYNVSSITLKLLDGGNKSGTIYWDNVRFLKSKQLIDRIYISANQTTQLTINPVEIFETGEVLGIQYKNNDTTAREFTVIAKGVIA
jgi:hypothetical protein